MLKILGWLFKVGLFAILVLVLANSVKIGGKTINDQVRINMAHAERSTVANQVKSWATEFTDGAQTQADEMILPRSGKSSKT